MRLVTLMSAKELKNLPEFNTVYKLKTVSIGEVDVNAHVIFIKSHEKIFGLFLTEGDGIGLINSEDFPMLKNVLKTIYIFEEELCVHTDSEFPDEFHSNILRSKPGKITNKFFLSPNLRFTLTLGTLEEIKDIKKYLLNLSVGNTILSEFDKKEARFKKLIKMPTI